MAIERAWAVTVKAAMTKARVGRWRLGKGASKVDKMGYRFSGLMALLGWVGWHRQHRGSQSPFPVVMQPGGQVIEMIQLSAGRSDWRSGDVHRAACGYGCGYGYGYGYGYGHARERGRHATIPGEPPSWPPLQARSGTLQATWPVRGA